MQAGLERAGIDWDGLSASDAMSGGRRAPASDGGPRAAGASRVILQSGIHGCWAAFTPF